VKLVPIRIGGTSGNDLLVSGGVAPGQTVVTAGVNLLKPGQKVILLEDDSALRDAKMAEAAPTPATGASTGAVK
jgi:multidrug efflux pump subunit AcrA (membrane-fusion protein)